MLPLLIKFPSRSRPRLFAETFARWNAVPEHVRFIVSLDRDDEDLAAYLDFLRNKPNVQVFVGESDCKVAAINRDVERADFPWSIIVPAADDMLPQRTDYAAEIARLMEHNYPDTDGVLHLNDGRAGERCPTMPVLGRKFYDRFGRIFCDQYRSVYCDDDLGEVAKLLGKIVYVPEVLIKHEWLGGAYDVLARRNEDRKLYDQDGATFQRRKAAGFPCV